MPSEYEMREFFQSVIDQIATLSTQAQRVEGLEQRVNELTNKVNELSARNDDLLRQVTDANNTVAKMDQDFHQLQQNYHNEQAVSQSLRDMIVQRDGKVVELESSLVAEKDGHRLTVSERDDARRNAEELGVELDSFRKQLQETQADRDHWKAEAYRLETDNADLKQRLERVNSILNPPHPVANVA